MRCAAKICFAAGIHHLNYNDSKFLLMAVGFESAVVVMALAYVEVKSETPLP
jgi:hypothetical protein